MYTILDELADQQLLSPITRKQPREACARKRTGGEGTVPAAEESAEPWMLPLIDEPEWQLFLKTMLDELRKAPVEARNIFNAILSAVTDKINQR